MFNLVSNLKAELIPKTRHVYSKDFYSEQDREEYIRSHPAGRTICVNIVSGHRPGQTEPDTIWKEPANSSFKNEEK